MNQNMPLTDSEIDALAHFLTSTECFGFFNMEMLDGYFVGLNCIPEVVEPFESLHKTLGDIFHFPDTNRTREMKALLMRHWASIQIEMKKSLQIDRFYSPIISSNGNDKTAGYDWSRGFLLGMNTRPEYLENFHHEGDICLCFVPLIMLAEEFEAETYKRNGPIPPPKRESMLRLMPVNVAAIYRYFSEFSSADKKLALSLGNPATSFGRDRPCPCGSKKKFKDCCAISLPTLH